MKNSEDVTAKADPNSPLPRFLRGVFRGAGSNAAAVPPPSSSGQALPEPEAVPVFAGRDRPPKVLVVDDDPVVLKALEIKLSRAGCRVLLGHDGPEAIALARKEQPDVIVLDIGLPADVSVAWDGVRVMQWIRRVENGEAPPVIIMTASQTPGVREDVLANGAVAFFQKPVDNQRLIEAIGSALAAPRSKTAPAAKSLSMVPAPTPAPASAPVNTDASIATAAKSSGFALY